MFTSINPFTGEKIFDCPEISTAEIEKRIVHAHNTFGSWKMTSFEHRKDLLLKLAAVLEKNKEAYAKTMTLEMGKPIVQAQAEIEKCSWLCRYYAENGALQLEKEEVETEASLAYVRYDPLGVVLAVMPWNYPFWQVLRFAVPALMAGNVGLLKHASNVMQSAESIQEAFLEAGFPDGCFQNLPIQSDKVEAIICHQHVKAVTLTGSKPAGSAVAAVAGEEIKKSVLELGGSNALVVFEDAKLEETVATCVQARFQNTGQSCIAGKRLLVHEAIFDAFVEKLIEKTKALKIGNPLAADTYIGVMARTDLAEELEDQVNRSVAQGAKIALGGKRNKAFFEPTIVLNVKKDMPVFAEETFGPVLAVMPFRSDMEALDLVNESIFGLGVSIFTENRDRVDALIPNFEDGAVFVNTLVKSDPRLPFGGTKISGYGRELSQHGIHEFVNKKTVYIK